MSKYPCGTPDGWYGHHNRGERVCHGCIRALSDMDEGLMLQMFIRDATTRWGAVRAREMYAGSPDAPDDPGYHPTRRDPLLTGVARATGETAAAVKRGRSVTRWQWDERRRA